MLTSPAFLGILVLAVLIVAWPAIRKVIQLLFFRTAVKMALTDVGKRAVAKQLDAVHLVQQDGDAQSVAERDRAQFADPLLAKGFSVVGLFSVQEMAGVDILQLVNHSTNVYANLYSHPRVGKWLELVSRYQDGAFVSFSTQPERGLEHRPGDMIIHAPGTSPDDLYERMLRERPDKPIVNLRFESTPRLFEKGYAELAFWRKHKGISAQEVAKVAVSLKQNPIGKSAGTQK